MQYGKFKKGKYRTTICKTIKARFENLNSWGVVPFEQVIHEIKDSAYSELFEAIKELMDLPQDFWIEECEKTAGDVIKHYKQLMPKVYPGTIFWNEDEEGYIPSAENFITNDGLVILDVDGKDNEDLEYKMGLVFDSDKYVYCAWKSFKGDGYKIIVKTPPSETWELYGQRAESLIRRFKLLYDIEVDKASKTPSCGTFISFDLEMYINDDSETYAKKFTERMAIALGEKKKPSLYVKKEKERGNVIDIDDGLLDEVFRGIYTKGLVKQEYDWFTCGKMIAGIFGNSGRHYFSLITDYACEKHIADRKWKSCMNSSKSVTDGSFWFWLKKLGDHNLNKRIKENLRQTKGE